MVEDASSRDGIAVRQATVDDIPDLVRLRRMMFEAMQAATPAKLDTAESVWAVYFAEAIPAEAFHGWLAVTSEDEVVSVCGVVIDQHPPTPGNPSGRIGYVMNVVTVPEHRHRGLARCLMQTALQWLDERGIRRVTLHATDVGQSLYESLGFEPVPNEMRLEKSE
jgi:ribosomal protein S18 acetylase RimI-like enzyme